MARFHDYILNSSNTMETQPPVATEPENKNKNKHRQRAPKAPTTRRGKNAKVVVNDTDIQPAQSTQPDQPAQPVEPIEPIEPVQHDQPAQPAQPVQPVQPAQPIEPVQPVQPVQPAQPIEPVQPAQQQSVLNFDRTNISQIDLKYTSQLGIDDLLKILIVRGEQQKNPVISTGCSRVLKQINRERIMPGELNGSYNRSPPPNNYNNRARGGYKGGYRNRRYSTQSPDQQTEPQLPQAPQLKQSSLPINNKSWGRKPNTPPPDQQPGNNNGYRGKYRGNALRTPEQGKITPPDQY